MLTADGFRLDGRVALVTGSGRNIGRAVAESFAQAGAKVVVNGHKNREAADEVVRGIQERGGEALTVMADVGNDEEVGRLIATAVAHFGALDIVVSNVGIRRYQPFLDITPDQWREVIDTNLSAAFYLARHSIPHMRTQGKGRFIVVSGFDGFWGHVTHRAHNVTAKAGLHGMAKALAREFGPDGITVNTVAPGAIDTVRDWTQYVHQAKEKIIEEIPLKRFGHIDELAGACLFLASDAGGFVSGQVIHVNGGHYMI